jgi:hypothetical protein
MTTVRFEGLAPLNSSVNIPNGYAGFQWLNFGAMGKEQAQGTLPITNGYLNAIQKKGVGFMHDFGSGQVSCLIQPSDLISTMSLKSGIFAAAWNNDETMFVRGWVDGNMVVEKQYLLGQEAQLIEFGRKFAHVDYVTFTSQGGVDATPDDFVTGAQIAVENLQIVIDGAGRGGHAHDAVALQMDTPLDHWPDVPFA